MPKDSTSKRDPRYDILFEPVKIGPVTAKNRFYQVPHCNGGGYRDPSAAAQMRNIKAQGGWGVIFTEQVEMHQTSEITPFIELRLWEDKDIPGLARMAEAMKTDGALAGIELAYSGVNGGNLYTKEVPMAPSHSPILTFYKDPVSARAMDKQDIRDLRRWHRNACLRAKTAGYDIIELYGAHGFGVIQHFLSPLTNQRDDEYGGSLENRARLFRELISECKDAVGDSIAISVRLSLEEIGGLENPEVRDMIEMNADLPDLWDLGHGTWEDCSGPSRFTEEGAQEPLVRGIKELTDKPVVGVGRFTSPDAMVSQIKRGVLDFIGAARPSIADPFIPRKIDEGRVEDIRECIGCNICVTGDMTMSISRCTQNPTFMEEWRKGWHPEEIDAKGETENVLIIGAGPAGLEAARAAGERGYQVALAEAGTELGGRVALECQLPGLATWGRVCDYRQHQISTMPNVEVYFDSRLSAQDVLDFGFENVAIATGSTWRRDGVARHNLLPISIDDAMAIFTPDDLMAGKLPEGGHVVLYDDDHYYMGGVLAELLVQKGLEVTLVTPANLVSEWTLNTLEQHRIQARMIELGVNIITAQAVTSVEAKGVTLACAFTGRTRTIDCDATVLVTCRLPNDDLWQALKAREDEWKGAGIKKIERIGDANAPAPIAWATYAGHRFARELDVVRGEDELSFRREVTELAPKETFR
ncbi:FAD-dependent oxidoreductase [Roseovarius sp. Pro17]|uniref:oxidoreductase n=1 Tax=Roseovarius sp. Pro17 TaxID=3108175 RepID=UPI002D786B80|nr:FAD-dependent oxidoreductase [Roseovarius sp. Pro17]